MADVEGIAEELHQMVRWRDLPAQIPTTRHLRTLAEEGTNRRVVAGSVSKKLRMAIGSIDQDVRGVPKSGGSIEAHRVRRAYDVLLGLDGNSWDADTRRSEALRELGIGCSVSVWRHGPEVEFMQILAERVLRKDAVEWIDEEYTFWVNDRRQIEAIDILNRAVLPANMHYHPSFHLPSSVTVTVEPLSNCATESVGCPEEDTDAYMSHQTNNPGQAPCGVRFTVSPVDYVPSELHSWAYRLNLRLEPKLYSGMYFIAREVRRMFFTANFVVRPNKVWRAEGFHADYLPTYTPEFEVQGALSFHAEYRDIVPNLQYGLTWWWHRHPPGTKCQPADGQPCVEDDSMSPVSSSVASDS